jgi:glyoxylase-like metal-dependent hydrolase (beta-lactamase superfamily II)
MLRQVADGVLVHESEFIQSNSVVVQGRAGVLLIDPGITRGEMADLGDDLRERGRPVVAGFSTHPDWDHLLWHPAFGDVPRYGTARCAASIREVLSHAGWEAEVAEGLPPEYAVLMPFLDLEAADPIGDYLAALRLFEGVADDVDVVIPGHGSVGDGDELRARIRLDRAYVEALRNGAAPDDPRVGPSAPLDWLPEVHAWQLERLAGREQDATSDQHTAGL